MMGCTADRNGKNESEKFGLTFVSGVSECYGMDFIISAWAGNSRLFPIAIRQPGPIALKTWADGDT